MVGCDKAVLLDRFVIYIALPMSLQLALVQFFFNWMWNSAEEDHEIPVEHRVAEGLGQTDFEKYRKNQGFGID